MKRSKFPANNQQFDLLVCGGGIYGAWTAYDAALRGLKVILVEQGDWASGTSSASSKLVHGGLRYLETLGFSVVKKSLTERHKLTHAAPYRVWPLRFGVPVNQHSRIGSFRLKIGLSIYDFLAGIYHSNQTHLHFDATAFSERFPILNKISLKSGYTYLDAQTDDARFVLEIIDGAVSASAVCINYCQLIESLENDGVTYGAVLKDQSTDEEVRINTSTIVKAIGQWTSLLVPEKQWCRLSKGVHLILPPLLANEALLLTAQSDGRVFFVIPWYGLTLLGTTDTDYKGDVDQVSVEKEDVDYLLREANLALTTQWTENDIQGRFAGLRVLQNSRKDSPSSVSREWELKSINQGLFYSIGGKLTSSREDAAEIVDAVCQYLGQDLSSKTSSTAFPWLPEDSYDLWSTTMTEQAEKLGIDSESALWLLRRHGKHVTQILQSIEQDQNLAKRITDSVPLIVADLLYCLEHEMVSHLEDLLRRRIPLLILYRMTKDELEQFAEICAESLGWDQKSMDQEIQFCAEKWLIKSI